MTQQQPINESITILISRMINLQLTSPTSLPYWKSEKEWKEEIAQKITYIKKQNNIQ